jgi:hypothetical protein
MSWLKKCGLCTTFEQDPGLVELLFKPTDLGLISTRPGVPGGHAVVD